jgi:hypothetical protein
LLHISQRIGAESRAIPDKSIEIDPDVALQRSFSALQRKIRLHVCGSSAYSRAGRSREFRA